MTQEVMVRGGRDWQRDYEQGHTPWDLRGVTPPLQRLADAGYFSSLGLRPGARVALPCCGRGHDLRVFAELGFAATGFDIAPGAVTEANDLLELNRVTAQVHVRDAFGLQPEFTGRFDLVYDYIGFCTIPPHLRHAYCREMAGILAPGGWLLLLAYPMRPELAGDPPFLITEAALRAATGPHLPPVDSFAARDSVLARRGAERWFRFRKPPS